jgi:uncharacterized membrane protein SpoIIM required for sporulation
LARLEGDGAGRLGLPEIRRLHYLYERAASDLGHLATFAAEPGLHRHLESLVARAYAEIHGAADRSRRFGFWKWLTVILPQTFRRHAWAFAMAIGVTVAGALFGGMALALDPAAKPALMPFSHLLGDPNERVAREELGANSGPDAKGTFSAQLMTHNTRVSIATLALGITWGIGTLIVLFYNGVILGAVVTDYVGAGQTTFLAGWLLPHGSIEIPAILMAGQAGLILGATLLGRGRRVALRQRLRALTPDLVTLICGAALLLVWAGLVEAFLSQYHEPHLPYSAKIAFGILELAALAVFLGWCGRTSGCDVHPEGGESSRSGTDAHG